MCSLFYASPVFIVFCVFSTHYEDDKIKLDLFREASSQRQQQQQQRPEARS